MSGCAGVTDQRLHATERNRVPRNPEMTEEIERRGLSTSYIERDDSARKLALGFEDSNLPGIVPKSVG